MSTSQVAPIVWAQFEASERYRVLTDRQKVFVTAYLTGHSPVESVLLAFRCKDEKTAKVMSYQVLQHPKVADCIAEFQGKTELEIQIEGARRDVLNAPDYEKTNARRLLCELTGLLAPSKFKTKPADSLDAEPEAPKTGVSDSTSRVPVGTTALRDSNGVVRGYKTADGQFVQLADVEVVR